MTKGSAFVIGATGQIGRAAVRALAEDGWEVRAASRSGGGDADWPGGVQRVRLDREDDAALAAALGDGVDVLVDVVAYGQRHARQLTGLGNRIGSAVVISSGAVYEDDKGRSFDTQSEPDGAPRYPVPIADRWRRWRPATPRTAPGRSRWSGSCLSRRAFDAAACGRHPWSALPQPA